MSMSNIPPKQLAVEADVDIFRRRAQWDVAIYLVEKLHRKYNATYNNQVLLSLIHAEQLVHTLFFTKTRFQHASLDYDSAYLSPSIFLPTVIPESATKKLQESYEVLLKLSENSNLISSSVDHDAVFIILAFISFLRRDYQVALKQIKEVEIIKYLLDTNCDLKSISKNILDNINGSNLKFNQILQFASLTIFAAITHVLGENTIAYNAMTVSIEALKNKYCTTNGQKIDTSLPTIKSPSKLRESNFPESDVFLSWVDLSLYFYTMLSFSSKKYVECMDIGKIHFACYPLIRSIPGGNKRCVSVVFSVAKSVLEHGGITDKNRLNDVKNMLPILETEVTNILSFPRGEDGTSAEKNQYNNVQSCYDIWNTVDNIFIKDTRIPSEKASRYYELIETLYRGTKHTFHSTRLLRYLSHAFVGLVEFYSDCMCEQEKIEAEAAIDAYIFFYEKHLKVAIDLERKKRLEAEFNRDPEALALRVSSMKSRRKSRTSVTRSISPSLSKRGSLDSVYLNGQNGIDAATASHFTIIEETELNGLPVEPDMNIGSRPDVRLSETIPESQRQSLSKYKDNVQNASVNSGLNKKLETVHNKDNDNHSSEIEDEVPDIVVETDDSENEEENDNNDSNDSGSEVDPARDVDVGLIAISKVDGESLIDALSVFVAGVKLLIYLNQGSEEIIIKACNYSQRAHELLINHGTTVPGQYNKLELEVHRAIGLAYGELALEVSDSKTRRHHQITALRSLRIAVKLSPDDGYLLYQLALQHAEVGQIANAIHVLRQSLSIFPTHAPSWNLLAIMFSCKKDIRQAIESCERGWKTVIASLVSNLPSEFINHNNVSDNKKIQLNREVWDQLPFDQREQLFNLRLTQLAVETSLSGADKAFSKLEQLFALFQRMFGTLLDPDLVASVCTKTINGYKNGAASVNGASTGKTGHFGVVSTLPISYFRIKIYDLSICLWLAASSIYRSLERIDDANNAVRHAVQTLEVISALTIYVNNSPTRLFRTQMNIAQLISDAFPTYSGLFSRRGTVAKSSSMNEINNKGLVSSLEDLNRRAYTMNGGNYTASKTSNGATLATWGSINPILKRICADIAFEDSMIRQAEYERLVQMAPFTVSYVNKFLSPAAKVVAEHKMKLKREALVYGLKSTSSMTSLFEESNIPMDIEPNAFMTKENRTSRATSPTRSNLKGILSKDGFKNIAHKLHSRTFSTDSNINGIPIKKRGDPTSNVQKEHSAAHHILSGLVHGSQGNHDSAHNCPSCNDNSNKSQYVSNKHLSLGVGTFPATSTTFASHLVDHNLSLTKGNSAASLISGNSWRVYEDNKSLEVKRTPLTDQTNETEYYYCDDLSEDGDENENIADMLENQELTNIFSSSLSLNTNQDSVLTLDSLIESFYLVSLIDDDHLATRIHLGILYLQKGDIYLAEQTLSRACKTSKARGGTGGRLGQCSWYSGFTGVWGWYGWFWLARTLERLGATELAADAIKYSVQIENLSGIRGLECLPRF